MKKFILIAFILVVTAGMILASYLGTQKPETTYKPEIGFSSEVTAEVNKYIKIKMLSQDKKVAVYIPAHAVVKDAYLTLTSMEPNLFTDPNSRWNRPVVINLDLYDNLGALVEGPMFEKHLDICFLFDGQERTDFMNNRQNYFIQYYDEDPNKKDWVNVDNSILYTDSSQFCGEIDHLSLFSLAIKEETQLPAPDKGPYAP